MAVMRRLQQAARHRLVVPHSQKQANWDGDEEVLFGQEGKTSGTPTTRLPELLSTRASRQLRRPEGCTSGSGSSAASSYCLLPIPPPLLPPQPSDSPPVAPRTSDFSPA